MWNTTLRVGRSLRVVVNGEAVATITLSEKSGQRVAVQCDAPPGVRIEIPPPDISPTRKKIG